MEITQRPEFRQRTVLSPQVYQGLAILSMPLAELEVMIEAQLLENPVLETDDFADDDHSEQPDEERADANDAEEQEAWDDWLAQYEELSDSEPMVPRDPNPLEVNSDDFVGGVTSFDDHLLDQLRMLDLPTEVDHAARAVVGSLDDDGFFVGEVEEIAAIADVSLEVAERGLEVVQQLDPPGVGAREVREALFLQMAFLEIEDDVLAALIEHHLDDVATSRFRKISRALHVSEECVREAVDVLRTLNPRPAGAFSPGIAPAFIVPDVTLRREGDEWLVIPNNEALPVLRVSPRYRSLLRDSNQADQETVRYVKDKIRGAESFIRNVERRKDTVSRIAQIVLETQQDFFEDGQGDLRPLRLEDVAVEIGVHLSTVSRGVTGKYMATPYGLFELKFFFSGGYRTNEGMDVAATTVKKRLRELVDEEDPAKPLSDQRIADALEEQGVSVARRTVAKYREELGIEPSWARRRNR